MTVDYRSASAKLQDAVVADENANHNWLYRAVRPMPCPPAFAPGAPEEGDCSKWCQYHNRWIGVNYDPLYRANGGVLWGLYGNSATIWANSQHLDHASELQVGDFVTFGADGDEHAAVVREAGTDPLVTSFGHQGAPNQYRLSQDPRPQQYCVNPLPVYVPTPQDKLRAKTTWFAWVNWRNGTGDWRPYAKADKLVRPNVPKRIPIGWWVRLWKFNRAAKKNQAH